MKKLKVFFSCLLVFVSIFMVSCKKNNNTSTKPPQNEQEESFYDALKRTYENLYNVIAVRGTDGKNFANSDGTTIYTDYLSPGLELLKSISKFPYSSGVVYSGEVIETTGAKSANKVEKFYIDSQKIGSKYNVDIHILCAKPDFSKNPFNFTLVEYNIGYDMSTDQYDFHLKMENSTSGDDYTEETHDKTQSHARCFYFMYDSKNMFIYSTNYLRATKFDIEDDKNINPQNIMAYYFIFYECRTNSKMSDTHEVLPVENTKETIESIKIYLREFETAERVAFELETAEEVTLELSDNIIPMLESFQ